VNTPTSRCLAHARKQGWPAGVTERWNPAVKIRHDLFGWIDLVVLREGAIVGVQATSGPNHASRVDKVAGLCAPWCDSGGLAEVWSWSKRGARGKRKLWTLRVEQVEPGTP
jgi:hypothetical protein